MPLSLGLVDSGERNNFMCISRGECGLGEVSVKIRRIQGSIVSRWERSSGDGGQRYKELSLLDGNLQLMG